MIAWDFVGPEVEDEERRELTALKRHNLVHSWRHLPSYLCSLRHRNKEDSSAAIEDQEKVTSDYGLATSNPSATPASLPSTPSVYPSRLVACPTDTPFTSRPASPTLTHAESTTQIAEIPRSEKQVRFQDTATTAPGLPTTPPSVQPLPFRRLCLRSLRVFTSGLLSPASLSVILAFPIALITPLKGLLVALPNSPIPNAPDGQPPLAFVMDTASFVGAASVPLGLICLGSALARLKVPRGAWRTMPLGAIFGLAVAKIVVSPVLGVLICQGLTNAGIISKGDKVLRFVCMCVSSSLSRFVFEL